MVIRQIEGKDYETLCNWWTGHKWPIIPANLLPQTGFIVEGLCAGFLYKSDSKIAWMEWIISNPESSKGPRSEALNLLLKTISENAKMMGYEILFTSAVHSGLIERYKASGFEVNDTAVTTLTRRL